MIPEATLSSGSVVERRNCPRGWLARNLFKQTGGPISGVFTGAAAPMAITTAFPPGFTNPALSIFQLFVNQTFPDGSIWPHHTVKPAQRMLTERVASSAMIGREKVYCYPSVATSYR